MAKSKVKFFNFEFEYNKYNVCKYECSECRKKITSKRALKKHIIDIHKSKIDVDIQKEDKSVNLEKEKCFYCGNNYIFSDYKNHLVDCIKKFKMINSSQNFLVPCKYCNTLLKEKNMKNHLKKCSKK